MASNNHKVHALEINADMIGALFTDRVGDRLRVFCFYLNGDTGQFDVPEEENRDSLHNLFAKLDMVGQCTSVILDKVVRGRIYVERDGNLFSYTLLATPSDVLPSINVEIYNLPWKTVWMSQEAQVLRLVGAGNSVHCYAICSPVNDVDAPALYRSSNAFVNPLSVPMKVSSPNHWVRQAVVASLLIVCLGLGWWLGYSYGHGAGAMRVSARGARLSQINVTAKVHMLANRNITGPYTMKDLGRMNEEGKIPADAMFRVEGSTEWLPLTEMPLNSAASITEVK
ncbi:MAG: hypothetical protein RLY20_3561 [Verrucomicrobiota bacterium]|jgi:hypothetical protein